MLFEYIRNIDVFWVFRVRNSRAPYLAALFLLIVIKEITEEFNITTIVNTHDMNSVLEIGDKILYLHRGEKWWEGTVDDILRTDNKELNEFIFASKLAKNVKKV